MAHKCFAKILILVILFVLPTGCVQKQQSTEKSEKSEKHNLNSIIVLPTDIIKSERISFRQSEGLKNGSGVLEELIRQYLSSKSNVNFVSVEQQDTLLTAYNQDRVSQALSIGSKLSSEAVLTSRINRYTEREGKEYSVDAPASIAFEYRLMLVETGQTLCAGVFDETQKSWSENILSYKQVFNRKGKWITVEDLAKEGLKQKFNSCRYF